MGDTPSRRLAVRRAPAVFFFVVAVTLLPVMVVAADRFTDVPSSNVHHDDITWLADAGVTVGCNPPTNDRFCPEQPVLRQQMASFLRRLAENRVVDAATAVEAQHAVTADRVPGQLVSISTLNVDCAAAIDIDPTYRKVVDVGQFQVLGSGSTIVATFNGRVHVREFTAGTGALFELRIDDQAPSTGRARVRVRSAEAGANGVHASMTGVFDGLAEGTHTVSIWARTSVGGAGMDAMVDPGCWSSDQIVIQEFAGS